MMLLSLLAVAATHFGGGSANDLAKSIHEATGQNVVVYQAVTKPIPVFDYDTSNLNVFAQTLRSKAGLMMAPGSDYILYDGTLPPTKMPPRYFSGQSGPMGGKGLSSDAIQDGKITVKTTGTDGIAIAALANAPFSKKLTADPYFDGIAVFAQVKDQPERDFLNWVAKASGGRIVMVKDTYSLQVDGNEVRNRAIRMVSDRLKALAKNAGDRSRDELMLAVLQQATPADIALLVNGKKPEIQYEIGRGSPLATAATARLTAIEDAQTRQPRQTAASQAPIPLGIMSRIDSRRSSYAVLGGNLEAYLDIAVMAPDGRPAGIQRF
jgi:hypothetical protein